jgi:hypothetical protein
LTPFLVRFGEKAFEPLIHALQFPDIRCSRSATAEIAAALRKLVSRHPDLLNRLNELKSGTMRHHDFAAVAHQDNLVAPPGHKDIGGGSCLYHGDSGRQHSDIPGAQHRDSGLPVDFTL